MLKKSYDKAVVHDLDGEEFPYTPKVDSVHESDTFRGRMKTVHD